jgi:SP family galactose:H+ symporter-like MFS transporter
MSIISATRPGAKRNAASPRPLTEPPPRSPAAPRAVFTAWLAVVLVVVLFSGGLFGYDQGVISGALAGIKSTFALSPLIVEVVTSWVTLGALLGALAGGELADNIGRRRAVLIAGSLFTVGAAIQAFAPDAAILVVGRLVIGAGVGVAAVAAPLYAAELAPASWRGRFVSAYQLAITVGIFLAYLIDGWLSVNADWRIMLGAAAVPGLLLFFVALVAPESPRWLMKKQRRADAAREMQKIAPAGDDVEANLDEIASALNHESSRGTWSEVFHRDWRRPLMIGLGLAIFQQVTGINAIIYYADQIFGAAGFATEASRTTATTWAIGAVNVLSTLIAIAFIDHLGRRKLLLAGLLGMGVSLIVVGAAFQFIAMPAPVGAAPASAGPSAAGVVTLLGLVTFIVSFAFSLGPVVWTVINEIFPGRIRGRAVAICTAVNWGSAFLVSQFFLSLVAAIGSSATFWLFAAFSVIGWVWVYIYVPETKGQSLEQIQGIWKGLRKRPSSPESSRI